MPGKGSRAAAGNTVTEMGPGRSGSFRVIVRDDSMTPTLRSGDRLYVDREAYRTNPPGIGEIVVLPDPEHAELLLVKRVAVVGPASVWATRIGFEPRASPSSIPPASAIEELVVPPGHLLVTSDRPRGARDSRRFGPVSVQGLLGRAWYRYAPVRRRGRL